MKDYGIAIGRKERISQAARISQKEAYYNNHNFFEVGGETVATVKPKPSKLQNLEKALIRLQDNYNACIKNGMVEEAAEFEAAIKKCAKKIAKAVA